MLVAGLLPTLAHAQPLPERHELRGKVLQSSGKPLVGASVVVYRTDHIDSEGANHAFQGAVMATGADGGFVFAAADAGSYQLSIQIDGYAPHVEHVDLNENTAPLSITLLHLSTLHLRVLKPDGSRFANATLRLLLRNPHASLPPLATNSDGEGGIGNLEPGTYWMQAIARGVGAAIVDKIELKENDTNVYEVKLQTGGTIAAEAREIDAPGAPANSGAALGGAIMTVERIAPDANPDLAAGARFTDESLLYAALRDRTNLVSHEGTGLVELPDMVPGRYVVSYYLFDYDPPVAQIVDIKSGETSKLKFLQKRRSPLASLNVTVRDNKDAPLANKELWVQLRVPEDKVASAEPGPPLPPDVPPEVANSFPGGPLRRAMTNAEGKLTIYPLKPGSWHVVIYPPHDITAEKREASIGNGDATVTDKGGQVTITAASH